jgi:hypothetical protein
MAHDNESRAPCPSNDHGLDARLAVETRLTGTDALRAMLGRIPGSGRVWNISVGVGCLFGDGVAGATRRIGPVLRPAVRVILHPPLLAPRYHLGEWLDAAARRGHEARLGGDIDQVIDALIPAVVERVLRQIDLTAVVKRHVDLDALVADVDMDAVIKRLDLVGLAEQVLDAIDLPEIIRESTGTMASETVREIRLRTIGADEAVARIADKILLRLRRGSARTPGGPGLGPNDAVARPRHTSDGESGPPFPNGTPLVPSSPARE